MQPPSFGDPRSYQPGSYQPARSYQPVPSAPVPSAARPRPEIEVRLPLQIGTSSLWSLARGSATLLPGLAVIGSVIPFFAAAGANKGTLVVAAAIVVLGGLLVWFAAMHLRLAARSRPSDVILRSTGIRIDGGVHHGRELPWSAIDPAASSLTTEIEKRYTFLRIVGNGFGVILTIVFKTKMWLDPQEFEIAKLRVRLRDGQDLLIAEAERPIEKESLEALFEAIRSSGWYGDDGAPRAKKPGGRGGGRHTAMGLSVLLCTNCYGVAIPDDADAVPCRFCRAPVPIPPATRERIAAARRVGEGRRASDRLVSKLIRQPGAGRTGAKLFLAAIPMMLAWPLAFAAMAIEADNDLLDALSALSLLAFPLAMILGLFFLLRAGLADRFALRLLTLDFGAQQPEKQGDPYTCRHCDAPLPDEPGSVVVQCRYCAADNILGLDLRRDAVKATREATSLEDALKKRSSERMLWGSLTVVAVFLVGFGGLALAQGVEPMVDAVMGTPAPPRKAAGAKPASPAPRPAPKAKTAPRPAR